jgi:transglutaminase-like putative cysteine protease
MLQATRPTLRIRLPDDPDKATETTLQLMWNEVDQAKADDLVRQTAADIVAAWATPKDILSEVRAIFEFVRGWVRYTRDAVGLESIASPRQVLLQAFGDCDDASIATSALLAAIGIESRLVALDFGRGFSHVVTEAHVDDDDGRVDFWITLDTTEPREFGWSPPRARRRMEIYTRHGH